MSEETTQTLVPVSPAPQPPALIPAGESGVMLQSMEDMYRFAKCVANSGLAPSSFKTPEAIIVAIQSGMEIGLSPMQALQNTCVINGKVGIYGSAALAVCMRDSSFEDVEEWYEVDGSRIEEHSVFQALDQNKNLTAVCELKAKGRHPVRRTFCVEDAKRAKLWGKKGRDGQDTPWITYPARMLRYKARHQAENDCFPNALKGIPLAEDLQTDYGKPEPRQSTGRVVETPLVLPGDEQ